MAVVRPLQERTPVHNAPTSLLSLPDEILEVIGCILFESDNECCHCEGHNTNNFKNYIRVSRRTYRAALPVGWRAWELSSESYERLLQHKDHRSIVRCVRHLHLPWVDNRTLGLHRPGYGTHSVGEDGTVQYGLSEVEPPATDNGAVDDDKGDPSGSKEKELETTAVYDQALAECISLFERLESFNITFCDWTMPSEPTMNVATSLLRARIQPILPSTITSSLPHFNTITRLSFSGVRSQEDQAQMIKCLEEHPRLHTNLQKLSIIYRFDYLLFSSLLVPADPVIDNLVDSKPLWTAIGKLEKLHSLTIAYMPQKDFDTDPMWSPEVFKPKLKRICLEEVALTQGVVKSLLQSRQGLKSLVAGPHFIDGIRELQATSEHPVTFPQLGTLELSLCAGVDCFDALAVFTHAPVTQLAMTTTDPLPFLTQYPEHKTRHRTVEVLALHEIYGDAEEETRLTEAQKEEWIQKYKDFGIKLSIQ